MNKLHPFYRPEVLRVLRYIGAGLLLLLLLAEWFIELPATFGLHAVYALSGVMLSVLMALAIGRLYGLARDVDDHD